jgi:lysozyme family protein
MDGAIGPLTLAAVKNTPDLINKFSQAKIVFYKSLQNPTYEQGWLNRVEIVRADALKMV